MQQPESTSLSELQPGDKLGKYTLLHRLAVGGMAEIYLAQTTGMGGFEKLVVLKRIQPQHVDNPQFVNMFLREARLVATLHHPNIAQVYDVGKDNGSYFFTMEFVHGQDLRAILRKAKKSGTPLPMQYAISIMIGACAGLHSAHEQRDTSGELLNIVHRDVSPGNILVSYQGCPKVVDFGIAKAGRGDMRTNSKSLKGKINYMSPEQCMGDPLDRRSDVFAIGIVLYEITTGKRLYPKQATQFALLNTIVNGKIQRPSKRVSGYPPYLEEIVMRALKKNPKERYASAQEMQLDLEQFAQDFGFSTSAVHLERYLADLFADEVREWKIAQDAGESLQHHIASQVKRDEDSIVSSIEDVEGEEELLRLEDVAWDLSLPKRKGPWRWVGLAAAVAGIVALGWFINSAASFEDEPTHPVQQAEPEVPDGPRAPVVEQAQSNPDEAAGQAAAKPSEEIATNDPADKASRPDDTNEAPPDEPATSESDEPVTKAKKPKRKKSKKHKRTKKQKPPEESKEPKPKQDKKWDQKSPLLPP